MDEVDFEETSWHHDNTDSEEDFETEDEDENDQFFRYILNGYKEKVAEKIREGYHALTISKYGDMALHFATLNSKIDILRLFEGQIRNKPEMNTVHVKDVDECGTALHTAMDGQVSIETVSFLLEWGADVDAKDHRGSTVLHELIDMAWNDFEDDFSTESYVKSNPQDGGSYLAKLSLLHSYGVDMNLTHELTRLTPVHKWCQQFVWCTEKCKEADDIPEWCSAFLAKMLEYGCDANAVDERGENPLFYFAQRHYKDVHMGYMKGYAGLCKILVEQCDLRQRNNNGHTILHAATEFSNIVLVRELLSHNIEVNIGDNFGLSPAHLITHNITEDEKEFVTGILELLRTHGADLNAKDNHRSTPMHHAIHLKNITAVQYLLQNGADLHIKDNVGLDSLQLAAIDGNQEVKESVGILYQRTTSPIVPGVSDVRIGYFYPRCCQHGRESESGDSQFDEELEIVYSENIQEYLATFSPCLHNRMFIIQNSIPRYEENKEQCKLALQDSLRIHEELMSVMEKTASSISNQNPLFECDVIIGGSNAEGTKVGSPDEFDFVFVLKKMSGLVIPVEDQGQPGFVKLKVSDNTEPVTLPNEMVNGDGFLKRSELSNGFHKLLEKSLRNKDLFNNSCFFSHAGTVNSQGECWDIGQLTLLWYGPFQKRQTVKIDIVPVLHLPRWQPQNLNSSINIISPDLLKSFGCFLVMKESTRILANLTSLSADDEDLTKLEDISFRISFSQLEHAVMLHLPPDVKDGMKIAKSIRMQCPFIANRDVVTNEEGKVYRVVKEKRQVLFVSRAVDHISSYRIKMALFHALDAENWKTNIPQDCLYPTRWNATVLASRKAEPTRTNVFESLKWTEKIFKKMYDMAKHPGQIPDYLLPMPSISKSFLETSADGSNIVSMYCNIILHFLQNFEIPEVFLPIPDE